MKKNEILFVIMCLGACMIDSEGAAFLIALAMVLIPAIVFIVGELFNSENSVNVSANIPEDVLVDYATRSDMNWEGGLI